MRVFLKCLWRFLLVILVLALMATPLVMWFWWPELHQKWYGQAGWDQAKVAELGQFGDSYGAFNAIFSGLAFIAVTITLRLQMREMQLQRREFEDSRRREHDSELRNRTIELFAEFHSLQMSDMRSTADLFLWDHPDENLDKLYDTHRKKADAVWMIIQFYQRLWFGIKYKHVEAEKVPELFGEIFIWWYTVYLADRLMPTNWESAKSIQHLYEWLKQQIGKSKPFETWSERAALEKETRRKPSPTNRAADQPATGEVVKAQTPAEPTLGRTDLKKDDSPR